VTNKVYTLGYGGRKLHEVEAIVTETEGILFDIRFSPRSRNPIWSGGKLRQALGHRYKHVKALGNVNYKGGPIELVDFDAGVEAIRKSGRPVILMCVCKSYDRCHRKHVAERLAALGFEIEEIGLSGPQQQTLF
jgi:uncharacterized protein (DUF488 family)